MQNRDFPWVCVTPCQELDRFKATHCHCMNPQIANCPFKHTAEWYLENAEAQQFGTKDCPICEHQMLECDDICQDCKDRAEDALHNMLCDLEPLQIEYLDKLLEGNSLFDFDKNRK